MIQIDDAGSGSFVGGTCIGAYRPETNEYYFDIIPVELYAKPVFKDKLYLDEVVSITARAFDALKVNRGETIEICRGYMFEKAKTWLDRNGYNWYCAHINGRVQEIVEKNFELYTIKLGLPIHYIKYTKYPFHFHKLLRWLYADYDSRIKLCKTGWQSWQKIEGIKPDIFEASAATSHMFCLRCGRHINAGNRIRIIRYISNKENYVIIHRDCLQSRRGPLVKGPLMHI